MPFMGYIAGVGWLATVALGVALSLAGAKIDVLKAREELLMKNAATLESAIETQANTLASYERINVAALERTDALETAIQDSNNATSRALAQLNKLRVTEENAALARPYERGLAAGVRLNSIMQRIAGNKPRESGDRSDAPSPDNP